MCEAKIEKAGSLNNIASVDWNADTKMAVLTYDPKITNPDEILKHIALAGYDSDKFLFQMIHIRNLQDVVNMIVRQKLLLKQNQKAK